MKGLEKLKKFNLIALIFIISIAMVIEFAGRMVRNYDVQAQAKRDPELLRAMQYDVFDDEEAQVEGTENINFSAFFLRDIDDDGYAEKLTGTCAQIGSQDTLYMEINVLREGRLENASISINGKNFYLQTALPKDNEIIENYVGNNTKTIRFNTISSGTQKLISGLVRSGDYTYASDIANAIGKDTNNYSVNDNEITLTGTYVANDGTRTDINKTINITVDWHGITKTRFKETNQERSIEDILYEDEGLVKLDFGITTEEYANQLILNSANIESDIPQMNGYDPISVEVLGTDREYTYNAQTRLLTIEKRSEIDENGVVTKALPRENKFTISVEYPIAAYYAEGNETEAELKVPVRAYYTGYNNPNEEFVNPYVSEVAKSTIIAKYRKPTGNVARADVYVGKVMFNPRKRYVVSRDNAIKIYNGAEENNTDRYRVIWNVTTGPQAISEQSNGIVLKESEYNKPQKSDEFIKTDATRDDMEDLVSNVGIYFSVSYSLLDNTNGFINVYDDETGELIATFDSSNWNSYSESKPYMYTSPVKHIRVETSGVNTNSSLFVYNIKEIENKEVYKRYTREQFNELQYINSNVAFYLGGRGINTNTGNARYESPYSIANMRLSKDTISTQETEKDETITIDTGVTNENQIGEWKNGSFLVKLPQNIIDIQLNDVRVSDSSVEIISSEIIEQDGNYFIKINTKNENPVQYRLEIDVSITSDPRIASSTGSIELYAKNEAVSDYYYYSQDIYDVDDNLNFEERVNRTTAALRFVAPNSLITNEVASEFDNTGNIAIAPQIAEIDTNKEEISAKVGIDLKNNYGRAISEILIVGKIPFQGNTYSISGQDMGSEITTKMSNLGISIPESVNGIAKVYYSEKETPSTDLNDQSNGWVEGNLVENWDNIKTFMIDLGDYTMEEGEDLEFNYTIEIPEGVEYNKTTYSHHGVYFSLNTDSGKYRTQLEPNKLGFRIAKKYDLKLAKYQTNKNKLVKGATYRVIQEDNGETKTATTDNEGKLEIKNLYAEKVYIMKEIKTQEDYALNEEEVKFITHIDENDNLYAEKIEGETKSDFIVTKNEGENYKASIEVEDEVNAKLKLTKFEQNTYNRLANIKFEVKGKGLGNSGILLTTNANGEANLSGLAIGEEYRLREVAAEGYYLTGNVKFKITNEEGTYRLSILEGDVRNSSVAETDSIPVANIDLEDEKIPTYNLEITKIKKTNSLEITGEEQNQEEITYLKDAKFRLYKNGRQVGNFVTGENGKFTINDLYQYVDGKDEDAIYMLKEMNAPTGYSKIKDFKFKAYEKDGALVFETQDDITRNYTVEGNTIKLTLEDSPIFKLIKKDAETGNRIPNVKFAIYNIDNDTDEIARNSKNEIIGTKEIINDKEYYVVKTDNNGEISLDLPEGIYKAVEVEAEEKYDISDSTYYFGIGMAKKGKKQFEQMWAKGINVYNNYISGSSLNRKYNVIGNINDGGYIVGESGRITKYNDNSEEIWNVSTDYSCSLICVTHENEILTTAANSGTVVKYDENGQKQWDKTFASGGNIYSMCEDSDGGYLVAGNIWGSTLDLDDGTSIILNGTKSFVIKLKASGEIQWVEEIANYNDSIRDIEKTPDGGFVVTGNIIDYGFDLKDGTTISRKSEKDGYIIKYNSSREIEWYKILGEELGYELTSMAVSSEGKIIVGGITYESTVKLDEENIIEKSAPNIPNSILLEYDTDGNIEWAKLYDSDVNDNYIASVNIINNDEIVVGGYANSSLGLEIEGVKVDDFVAKYDIDGNNIYVKNIGNYSSGNSVTDAIELSNGSILVSGYFLNIYDGNSGMIYGDCVIKYGKIERQNVDVKQISTIRSDSTVYSNILEATPDGGKIVACGVHGDVDIENGPTIQILESCYILIKYDKDGNVEWATVLDNIQPDRAETVYDIEVLENDGYIVTTGTRLIKYDLSGNIEWEQPIQYSNLIKVSVNQEGEIFVIYTTENEPDRSDSDVIIAKYSDSGEFIWSKRIEGVGHEEASDIKITNDQGILITMSSYGPSVTVDENTTIVNESGSPKKIIIKYNVDGQVQWYKDFEYISDLIAEEIEDNGIIVYSYFSANTYLGDGVVTPNRSGDGIVKYNSNGQAQWVKMIYDNGNSYYPSLTRTSDGGFAVVNTTTGYIDIEGYGFVQIGYSPSVSIIKYTSDGDASWVNITKPINGYIMGCDIIENTQNEIEFVGFFGGEIETSNGEHFTAQADAAAEGILIKLDAKDLAEEKSELIVENSRKEFKIKTEIEETNGEKGGTISGEGSTCYEKVKYGDSNEKEIKMTPDEGYEINKILINGEEITFEANEDGSYILPTLEDIKEDKTITVKYILKENKLTINKVDQDTLEPLQGAKFKIEEIDERTIPETTIGEMTSNSTQTKKTADYSNPIQGVIGYLTDDEDYQYHFVEQDGKYIPTNGKTYQVLNGGSSGIRSSSAGSYVPIDLTGKEGEYKIVVNARISSESFDKGKISNNYTDGTDVSITGVEKGGTYDSADYEMTALGGRINYLKFNYTKDSSVDEGEDQIIINSIKVYKVIEEPYCFIKNEDGSYESNNQGTNRIPATSYMEIDLTNMEGQYDLVVNAETSSSSYDYSYGAITTTPEVPNFYDTFINLRGTNEARDYTKTLDGGQKYYLHFEYYKSQSRVQGEDKFKINSVKLNLNQESLYSGEFETNSQGQIKVQLENGKYKITEIEPPYGYEALEEPIIYEMDSTKENVLEITNKEAAKVNVHHYYKTRSGEYTTEKVAEDDQLLGKIGEEYISRPHMDLEGYQLEKDENKKYVLPVNAAGQYDLETIEVNYYYEEKTRSIIDQNVEITSDTESINSRGQTVDYKITYTGEIDKFIGDGKVIITDRLPYLISTEEGKIELDGGIYNAQDGTITWEENYDAIDTNSNGKFEISITKNIRVTYLDVDINQDEVDNVVTANILLDDEKIVDDVTANKEISIAKGNVIVKYLDKATDDELIAQEQIINFVGTNYSTESKNISGYTLIEEPENKDGTISSGTTEVIYYYGKNSKVIVNYLERGTNVPLAESIEILGYEGKAYETNEIEVPGYTFVVSTPNTSGTMSDEDITVNYYYLKNAILTVKHIDRQTNEVLEEETINGKVGDTVETHSKNFEGYVLVESPESTTVVMQGEDIVEYYYEPVSVGLIEKHIDVVTDEIIYNEEHQVHKGQNYKIDPKEFEGYDIVEERLPDNAEGVIGDEVIEVNYYYIKKASVRVEYLDKQTGEKLQEDIVIEGHENDAYSTEEKEFENYVLDGTSTNASGEMVVTKNVDGTYNTQTEVIYYYNQKSAGVIEKHIDIDTNDVLEQEEYEGMVGEEYTTEPKEFEGYVLVEDKLPENTSGLMQKDKIEVNYYYAKQTKVIVKYLDKDTKKELVPQREIEGVAGEEYTTNAAEVPYYKVVETTNNTTGKMKNDEITVIYYYQKQIFNFKVDKWISNATLNSISRGGNTLENKDNIYKLEIHRKEISSANLKVTYKIKVTNAGEVAGKIETLEEYIPEGFSYYAEDNSYNWKEKGEMLILSDIDNVTLNPGESKDIEVVLRWNNSEANFGQKINKVSLTKASNLAGYEESNLEDNTDECSMLLTIATGIEETQTINIVLGLMSVLIVIATGILLLKRN